MDYYTLGISVVGSLSMGYVVGWALKKMVAVLEYVAALVVLLFGGAAMLGIITVNLHAAAYWLGWLADKVFGAVTADTLASVAASLGVPFLVGVAVGLSRSPARAAEPPETEWVE